ncbi:hypothetical protein V8B97DRAFT_1876784, partial [Scleroderma yunnanense]
KTALEPPVYPLPTWVPGPSFKHSFTPDSFTGSETFDSISTQVICERWAKIQQDLITGQEKNRYCKPIFCATTPTPPFKHSCK